MACKKIVAGILSFALLLGLGLGLFWAVRTGRLHLPHHLQDLQEHHVSPGQGQGQHHRNSTGKGVVGTAGGQILRKRWAGYINFTAIYAFGDASVDTGNNNILSTLYKSNHAPYGRNFHHAVPTGRFSDGKLIVDYLASYLGLSGKDYLPAYNDDRGKISVEDLQTGASFGNAGAGLIDSTSESKNVPTMDQQLATFGEAVHTMEESLGVDRAAQIVGDALYVISVGTNDMVDGYYSLEGSRWRSQVPLQDYHNDMIERLQHIIYNTLYEKGAQNVLLVGLPPIGCFPSQVTSHGIGNAIRSVFGVQRSCIDEVNADVEAFNKRLRSLADYITSLISVHVGYADIYNPIMDLIRDSALHGIEKVTEGCCGSGYNEMGDYCNPSTKTCRNPEKAVFWDAQNPTQAVNAYLAKTIEERVIVPEWGG